MGFAIIKRTVMYFPIIIIKSTFAIYLIVPKFSNIFISILKNKYSLSIFPTILEFTLIFSIILLYIYTFTMRNIFRPFPIILWSILMDQPPLTLIMPILKVSLIFCPVHIIISSITILQPILILPDKLISILILFYRSPMSFIIDPVALWLKSILRKICAFSIFLSICNLTFIFIAIFVIKNSFSMRDTIFGLTFIFVDIFKHFLNKLLIDWMPLMKVFSLLINLMLIHHSLIG